MQFSLEEVNNIIGWSGRNRMILSLTKTKKYVLKRNSNKPLPLSVSSIEQKPGVKLLGIHFSTNPYNLDEQFKVIMKKAKMYIWTDFPKGSRQL